MKYIIGITLLLFLSCQSKQNNTELKTEITENENNKLEVLLVGTFHFRNFNPKNNSDITQTNEVDVLTEQNQKELELISDKITEFNPDKIFVEYPFEKQSILDSTFQSFLPTNYYESDRNETVQLGFRVAKKLKHNKVFAYDYRNTSYPYNGMLETMEKANQTELIKKEDLDMLEYEKKYNELVQSTKSVTEILYLLNDEQDRKDDISWYFNSANKAGTVNDTIGSFLVSEWYKRNLYMYSIIQKQVTEKDKKIMIISGSSHIALFKDFIKYSPEWKTVELKEIMK
jgi:hypothetical protein